MRTLLIGLVLVSALRPAAAHPGQDATFPVGWRGDGSGEYPDTRPPMAWGMVSRPVKGLRYLAGKPAGAAGGERMADGVIREWLVLTPAPEGTHAESALLPNETDLCPAENEKAGSATWRKLRIETSWLDFRQVFGKTERAVAYAFTSVFSEAGGKFRLNATQLGGFQVVLNGRALRPGYGRYVLDLARGWNRLLVKVASRPPEWACGLVLQAVSPAEFETANIAWKVPLPGWGGGYYGAGTGCGSLIVVKDRLYLLSEPHDLICLDKSDGRILWIRTSSYFDAATEQDRKSPAYAAAAAVAGRLQEVNASSVFGTLRKIEEKARLEKDFYEKMAEVDGVRYRRSETPDVGFSGLTPVSDGKFIYLWLATGVTACYDLDGNRRWIRVDNLPGVEHGFSSSPILIDGKVVVFMRDLLAIDAASGAIAWRIPLVSHEGANPGGFFHSSLLGVTLGGVPHVVLGNGTILRARDGRIVFSLQGMGQPTVSTPVVEGDVLLQTSSGGMKLFVHQLPATAGDPLKISTRDLSVDTPAFPHYYMPWHLASPVVREGLAYLMNNAGVLTVVDVKENRILYQRMLDIDHFQTSNEGPARGCGISPALAGKYLYFFGNSGAAVILEPGRTFRQVAKNKIENLVAVGHWGERQERFVSNPVFDGDRLYLRGEAHLYAIDAKAGPGSTTRGGKEEPEPPVARPPPPAPAAPSAPSGPKRSESAPSPFYGWRRDGSGTFPVDAAPTEWSEKTNVKWRASVGGGASSPILWGDRVFVLSEPGTLACLGAADGKIRWTARMEEDLPPEVLGNVRDPPGAKERARATPVTDGANVYAALGSGVVACYSLEGKRVWVRHVEPASLTYGPSASPVLAGGTLLVDSRRLQAFEAATGRPLWKAGEGDPHYGTPALLSLGGTLFAVTSKGAVIRVSDGAVLADKIARGLGGDQAPSPVVHEDVVYFAYRRTSAVRLSLSDGRLRCEKLWEQELLGDVISSPVLKDGRLFVVPYDVPVCQVLEAKTGRVLLEKETDLAPNIYPSLALAGNSLFVSNDKGDTVVLEPGAECKEIRRNRLPEGSGASPAFAGSRLYLRGGSFLYCIGP